VFTAVCASQDRRIERVAMMDPAVPGDSDLDSAHVGHVPDDTGARILFFGIDNPDRSLHITSEQSNETFHPCLGIADQACADLII
jgi:hypothetical protein